MKEQIVSFEIAKLAKEKGFDLKVLDFYTKDEILQNKDNYDRPFYNGNPDFEDYFDNWNGAYSERFSAPTQCMLQEWLKEKHFIYISIDPTIFKVRIFKYKVGRTPLTLKELIEKGIGQWSELTTLSTKVNGMPNITTCNQLLENSLLEGLKTIN